MSLGALKFRAWRTTKRSSLASLKGVHHDCSILSHHHPFLWQSRP
nr:MAG TPA: hypothetical protein [Caudoviricetes sp.]